MAGHYCIVHGEHSSDYGYPDCQRSQERSEEASKYLLEKLGELSEQTAENARVSSEAAERAAYLTNNPGDYLCPSCLMKSLKYRVARCPLCRFDIGDAYWKREQEREQERERLKEEIRKRAEEKRLKWLASPKYAAQRREAEEYHKRAEALERKKKGKRNAIRWGLILFFGIPLTYGLVLLMWGAVYKSAIEIYSSSHAVSATMKWWKDPRTQGIL